MKYQALILIFVGVFALTAKANDDEMQTETKPGSGSSVPAGEATGKLPPSPKAPSPQDAALRAKIRKFAPFWIDDSQHGAAIRINKDGTFSSEAQGGGSTAGVWKALNNQLHIEWSGAEKYHYPTAGGPKVLLLRGKNVKKNRYNLN